MTHKLHCIFKSQLIALAAILSFTMIAVSSCTKTSSGNDAAKFVGTWTGTSTCGGATTLVFSAGSSGTTLTTSGFVGSGSCYKTITYNYTASGNSLTMNSSTYTDNCGNSYTFNGAGALSGNTLTFTVSGPGASCVFTGTK